MRWSVLCLIAVLFLSDFFYAPIFSSYTPCLHNSHGNGMLVGASILGFIPRLFSRLRGKNMQTKLTALNSSVVEVDLQDVVEMLRQEIHNLKRQVTKYKRDHMLLKRERSR